jgi:Fe-S-cluster containining protein
MKNEYPDCVKCEIKCADCCYALFDLSLIEALYINHHFNKKFSGKERERQIEKSNRIDRQVYKIKRKAYKDAEAGKAEDDILTEMANERIRCPLLNDQDECDLYDYRPLTCRFYGLPTAIGGTGHTCGLSGFVKGNKYPTVNLDIIQQKLFEISNELIKKIKSRHIKMADMLVPVSTAILTTYDDAYLGIEEKKDDDDTGKT